MKTNNIEIEFFDKNIISLSTFYDDTDSHHVCIGFGEGLRTKEIIEILFLRLRKYDIDYLINNQKMTKLLVNTIINEEIERLLYRQEEAYCDRLLLFIMDKERKEFLAIQSGEGMVIGYNEKFDFILFNESFWIDITKIKDLPERLNIKSGRLIDYKYLYLTSNNLSGIYPGIIKSNLKEAMIIEENLLSQLLENEEDDTLIIRISCH